MTSNNDTYRTVWDIPGSAMGMGAFFGPHYPLHGVACWSASLVFWVNDFHMSALFGCLVKSGVLARPGSYI